MNRDPYPNTTDPHARTWRDKAELVLRGFTVHGISAEWSPANQAYAIKFDNRELLGIVPKGELKGRIEDLFRPEEV